MRKYILTLIFSLCGIFSVVTYADNTPLIVCFSPGGKCTNNIVAAVNHAHKTLLIQAYQLTSTPIIKAILRAKQRGVTVKLILDKRQAADLHEQAATTNLLRKHIAVWVDYRVNMAHSNIMVIDDATIITGSFDFTDLTQQSNADNLLIINSRTLARIYTHNWQTRFDQSQSLAKYRLAHHLSKKG